MSIIRSLTFNRLVLIIRRGAADPAPLELAASIPLEVGKAIYRNKTHFVTVSIGLVSFALGNAYRLRAALFNRDYFCFMVLEFQVERDLANTIMNSNVGRCELEFGDEQTIPHLVGAELHDIKLTLVEGE